MIKITLLILSYLFITPCHGFYTIDTDGKKDSTPASFTVAYRHDPGATLTISDALKKPFNPSNKQYSFSFKQSVTWYKIEVNNPLDRPISLYLHNKMAYMSQRIDLYDVQDNNSINRVLFSTFDQKDKNKLIGSSLVYEFKIEANNSKTLYLKNKAMVHQIIDIDIYSKKNSTLSLINKNYLGNIIVIVIAALATYNLMLFFFIRRKEFIFYSLYLLNAAIGLFYMYGAIFHHFQIYGEFVYWLNLTAIAVPLLLSLFIQSIFDTHKNWKNIHTALNVIIGLALLFICIAILFSMNFAMSCLPLLYSASFLSICYMGYFLYKYQHPLLQTFALAYVFYIIGMSGTIAGLMGLIPFNSYLLYSSGTGLIIEALLFSYLLNFRIKLLEQEVNKLTHTHNKLQQIANIDELTKINNRRAFMEHSLATFNKAKQRDNRYAFLMIDIDHFKNINDSFGHPVGDMALIKFCEIIKQNIREEDYFARIGGEEFAIILPKLTHHQALQVAQKLRISVADNTISTDNLCFKNTISIGVATFIDHDENHTDTHKRADLALYKAKNNGRNCVL